MKRGLSRASWVVAVVVLLGLGGCSQVSVISQDGSTSVRGSNMQLYGTINQSYTRTTRSP
ncbi:hypothetical protein [Halothiobacillus sp. DCM-1]|uniref:hypothetical protein n=1 Tax=Halothiobacillus sp. DCM-1 TaxID=3112558 RepID=UPI0032509963